MSYGGETGQAIKASIVEDVSGINSRLANLLDRLIKLGTILHGPMPSEKPAPAAPGVNVPVANSLRNYVNVAHTLLSQCENELSRIESPL